MRITRTIVVSFYELSLRTFFVAVFAFSHCSCSLLSVTVPVPCGFPAFLFQSSFMFLAVFLLFAFSHRSCSLQFRAVPCGFPASRFQSTCSLPSSGSGVILLSTAFLIMFLIVVYIIPANENVNQYTWLPGLQAWLSMEAWFQGFSLTCLVVFCRLVKDKLKREQAFDFFICTFV